MPTAITAHAFGASWSIHQFTVNGCPVSVGADKVQYPSPSMMFSLGIGALDDQDERLEPSGCGRAERGQETLAAWVGDRSLLCR